MFSCSSTLSKSLLKSSFGKVVFRILVKWLFKFAKWKFVHWPPFWNETFFWSFFSLIYGYFGCKFRTEVRTGKYSKKNGSKWTPPPMCTKGTEKYLMHLSVKGYCTLHLFPPISMICVLSQNCQNLFEK